MATVFDASVLSHFTIIFSMILVMAIVYGILSMAKLFNGSKGLHILIAFIVGLMMVLVPDVTAVVGTMVPWFTLLFIFIVMLLLVYKIFGATDDMIQKALSDKSLIWVIIIIALIIALASFSAVYGQRLLQKSTGAPSAPGAAGTETAVAGSGTSSFQQNLAATFFHPKILGALFLLIIATIAMAILAMETTPSSGGGGSGGGGGHAH